MEWGIQNVDIRQVERTLRILFNLDRPMGFGRLNVSKCLSMYVVDEIRRPEGERLLEEAVCSLDNYQRYEEIVDEVGSVIDQWIPIAMIDIKEDLEHLYK